MSNEKIPVTPLGIELATFRLLAQCLGVSGGHFVHCMT